MKSIKFIHIGDVHYPESITKPVSADKKDNGFNHEFVEKLATNAFVEVGQCLVSCLEEDNIDGILFSGDLTSLGNVVAYDDCVNYFHRLITAAEDVTKRKIDIHVVPGNHDLKRKNLNTNDIEERFKEFEESWDRVGKKILPVSSIRKSLLQKDGVSLNVISLNTCLGCGEEYKKFPDEIAKVYKELLEGADLADKEQFDKFCDRIDTPAIHQDHLREIEQEVDRCEDNSLCLVLGHHALLPQPTVRVALYTEIINGGNARMCLTTLKNPVIYCHGHIHDDPIEILSNPSSEDSSLVLISAPEYLNGFNIIEFVYTDGGYPVGIIIHPYRAETWGRVKAKTPIRIPIRQPEKMITFCDRRTENVYRNLGGDPLRFDSIKENLEQKGHVLSQADLENIFNELEWLRVITISNKTKTSRSWVIGRVGL